MLPRRDVLGLLASALLLAACGEGGVEGPVGPRDSVPPPPAPRLLASAPVPRTLLGQAGSETVAYVSAPTGLLVRGALAAVVNQRTGERLLTPLAAGGFDPVALVATDGDVLEVTLTDSAGGVTTTPLTVKRGAKPRVVRTVPEPRATDVPLNSVIRVVFTTPVRASDAAGAIRLFSGGEEVAGTVRVDGEAAVIVDFEPATPLVANTDYELRVDASLRDVLGTALEAPLAVPFTTGTTFDIPIEIVVEPEAKVLRPGWTVELRAKVCVRSSSPCEAVTAPIAWASLDPGVVSVATTTDSNSISIAVATGVQAGRTVIEAVSGDARRRLVVVVLSPAPASLSSNEIVFVGDLELYAVRADGTGLRRLTSDGVGHGAPSVAADGRIAFKGSPAGSSDPSLGVREVDGSVRYLPLPSPRNGRAHCPAWSPDMRHIAYLETTRRHINDFVGAIRVVHADSTSVLAADFPSLEMTCPSWSPQGDLVASQRGTWGNVSLKVLRLDGGESLMAWGPLLPGELSPDGSEVVTLTYSASGVGNEWIERRSLVGSTARRLFLKGPSSGGGAGDQYAPPKWSPDGTLIALGSRSYGMILIDASSGEPQWLGDTWGFWDGAFWPYGYDPTFVPPGVSFTR